jgi:hypothetical protein
MCCLLCFPPLVITQKNHILITYSKFIITYTILSSTLSHNIHNMRIHMSNKHSHTFRYIWQVHTSSNRNHPHCLILTHIQYMKSNTISHTHKSYQDLHISRRRMIVRVMSTTVWSVVEELLNKWVPWPALLFTRCSHSGRWSVILQTDLIEQDIRDDFL